MLSRKESGANRPNSNLAFALRSERTREQAKAAKITALLLTSARIICLEYFIHCLPHRDYLLRVNLQNFNKSSIDCIYWPASSDAVRACKVKGQSDYLCHNYIQILLKYTASTKNKSKNEEIFVCGTNAFKPECNWRKADSIGVVTHKEDGITKCPFSPKWNTTSLFTAKGDYYYGGALDFMNRDAAIIKNSTSTKLLRTARVDSKWLNTDTNFVASFEDESFVYFVFRESAVEYINCGKAIYSRIGRVCKNDKGGGDVWTTFVKARLNCSIPGQFPFYFNEIQSATYLNNERKLYAIFATPENSIHGSAICAFSHDAIDRAFNGNFKLQASSHASWQAVHDRDARDQFECGSQSQNVDNDPIQTQQKFQFMDEAISSSNGKPFIFETYESFTHIAVDSIRTVHNVSVDMIFVLTKRNKLRRYALWPFSTKACFINEFAVTSRKEDVILTMQLSKDTSSLYLGTKYELIRVALSDCGVHKTEDECLQSNDPYCGWNVKRLKCTPAPGFKSKSLWKQKEEVSCSDDKNYDWSPWSDWEECDHMSGNLGDKCFCRWQQCIGIDCPLIDRKIEVTNCSRHGGWTEWSDWSPCSASCGPATQTRTRSCSNPSPAFGGRNCIGLMKEKRSCHNPPCPVSTTTALPENFEIKRYLWSEWGQWEPCSAKCGGGIQFSRRKCLSPIACEGLETRFQVCNVHPCAEVKQSTEWTKWYQTNLTQDGLGLTEERFKFTCRGTTVNGSDLQIYVRREDRFLDLRDSKRKWTECSSSCGGGVQFLWNGDGYLKRPCNLNVPCDGWSQWSKWSVCRKGERIRTKECLDASKCKLGKEIERMPCSDKGEGNSIDEDIIPDENMIPNEAKSENEVDSLLDTSNKVKVAELKPKTQSAKVMEANTINFSFVIMFCIISLTLGSIVGAFATYFFIRKKTAAEERHQRLSLKLFNNSSKSTANAYVTASDFKANNCNNVSPASSLLPPTSSFQQASSPLLFSPVKEATIKRASTIRAKLNSDQNF
ncbi:semaphorin-5A-like protein [Dinothrombium tinctorium]|uniref:Semaphorin-5A-like protein n=1 Tax=Dinothrombium tinctorium TaxID=1965070 RepID=A0A443RKM1_9ACAR|nr:semaphorin-5A-like protein [Dinothrombium tinctorium]